MKNQQKLLKINCKQDTVEGDDSSSERKKKVIFSEIYFHAKEKRRKGGVICKKEHQEMNISNTTIQTGHHHHHHQNTTSNASSLSNQQSYHHTNSVTIQQGQHQRAVVNQNPSVHRFQTLDENPWLLQSSQQGPIPPQRQHKRLAVNSSVGGQPSSSSTTSSQPPKSHINQHPQSINNSTYNQPVYLTSTAQTQTTPGLAPQTTLHPQISPKSPSQSFPQPNATGFNLMSTSLSGNSSNMNHMSQLHHVANLSNNNNNSASNNNNNSNFDDLNLNGSSSNNTPSLRKMEMKLNSMP